MAVTPSVVWFRDDLRLDDNPALCAAIRRDGPVVAVYVLDEESAGFRPYGGAAKWWLHNSLVSLAKGLDERGAELVLRRGPAEQVLPLVVAETGAGAVFWNRRYGAAERAVDARLKTALRVVDVDVASFAATLLYEPWAIANGQGAPYSVFTPFWRACQAAPPPRAPFDSPAAIDGWVGQVATDNLDGWRLLPTKPDWAGGFRESWEPGEASAHRLLEQFLSDKLDDYADERDIPGQSATSGLSPHLRWGEISPYRVLHETEEARRGATGRRAEGATRFVTELGWREFASHVLFATPDLATVNWRREFDAFPWPPLNEDALRAWQRGRTGIPIVDAGMRELWRTGAMHNRVRMIVASFLIKNLLIDWRQGEQWFWDTLVDADAANNAFNWQWIAGSGADAAPYFRIFNPELQAKKFDPHGEYIRQNVPEWGTDAYPQPIVDLAETRKAALAAYDVVTRAKRASGETQDPDTAV
jgi:deoxyribodipyrimidine photo-lyase